MTSKRIAYLVVLKLQAVEVAERTSKEVAARQFGTYVFVAWQYLYFPERESQQKSKISQSAERAFSRF